jgi:hypothetical protein
VTTSPTACAGVREELRGPCSPATSGWAGVEGPHAHNGYMSRYFLAPRVGSIRRSYKGLPRCTHLIAPARTVLPQ